MSYCNVFKYTYLISISDVINITKTQKITQYCIIMLLAHSSLAYLSIYDLL